MCNGMRRDVTTGMCDAPVGLPLTKLADPPTQLDRGGQPSAQQLERAVALLVDFVKRQPALLDEDRHHVEAAVTRCHVQRIVALLVDTLEITAD